MTALAVAILKKYAGLVDSILKTKENAAPAEEKYRMVIACCEAHQMQWRNEVTDLLRHTLWEMD